MKTKGKLYSIALASTALVLFLIFVSSTTSAAAAQSALPTITETQITTNGSAYSPAIYGDRIVWTDSRNGQYYHDIYMYNISTSQETQITTSGDASGSDIYGDRIVWSDYRNGEALGNIYMYDLSTHKETQITTNGVSINPAIYGDRVVWMGDSNGYDIYMYDLSTSQETRITTSGTASDPDIYGGRIVWTDHRNGKSDIYMYNILTSQETQISYSGSAPSCDIYGDRTVWQDSRNNNGDGSSDIYMYDLLTSQETQITISGKAGNPVICDNRIVWQDWRSGEAYGNIYMYDLLTSQETQITTNGFAGNPDIHSNRIVWQDWRNTGVYNSCDIYTLTLNGTEVSVGQNATTPEITQKFIEACDRNGGLSVLGNPTTEVYEAGALGFYVQDFPGASGIPGGVIMYNPTKNDAFYIHGAIWQKYHNYVDKAKLGPVASDEGVAAIFDGKTKGNYSKFETGTIHWISDRTGENINHELRGKSFVTYGDLDKKYTEMGGTYSELGFPIMDQVTKADGYDYCMFDGGIIVWDVSTGTYKAIISGSPSVTNIDTGFNPDPNGFKFGNTKPSRDDISAWQTSSWNIFREAYGPNLVDNNYFATQYYNKKYIKTIDGGRCFGFSVASLNAHRDGVETYDLTLNEDAFWKSAPLFTPRVSSCLGYYQATQRYPPVVTARSTRIRPNEVYRSIRENMSGSNPMSDPFVIDFWWWKYPYTDADGDSQYDLGEADGNKIMDIFGHTVVPYRIEESADQTSAKVYVYDSNHPGSDDIYFEFDLNANTVTALRNETTGEFVAGECDNYHRINAYPIDAVKLSETEHIPTEIPPFETISPASHLLYTDASGNQLGFLNDVPVSEISGAYDVRITGQDENDDLSETYLIPTGMELKREIIGRSDGVATLDIFKTDTLITVQEQVSSGSVDELNISKDASSVEFKSGKETPSLNLTIEKVQANVVQLVSLNTSNVETGGSIGLSNIDGTISIENDGQSRTCSLYIEQVGTNSNYSIENIVIEGDSTVFIKPSNWNDLVNSEVTIEHDFGSDGTIDSTETIRPKDNTPPSTVMDLQSTNGTTWINWTWINPSDPDFNHTEIYLNGIFQTNTSAEFFNATSLQPETSYTLSTRTVDNNGNVNETWVNSTATTSKKFVPTIPVITWGNPADIIYGTALSNSQLKASASVSGTFVYTPPSGTILSAGTQKLHVDFTPADAGNYTTAPMDVTINVLTPVQKIQQIITMVQSLNLNKGQANSLIVKLNAATKNLNNGNTKAATNELNAFNNEFGADIKTGKLSSTQGQALIDATNSIIKVL